MHHRDKKSRAYELKEIMDFAHHFLQTLLADMDSVKLLLV